MKISDWIGSIGVAILLLAFVLMLANKISKNGFTYLTMNFMGSGIAAIASYLINYPPFIILELAWMIASLFGIWKFFSRSASVKKQL